MVHRQLPKKGGRTSIKRGGKMREKEAWRKRRSWSREGVEGGTIFHNVETVGDISRERLAWDQKD